MPQEVWDVAQALAWLEWFLAAIRSGEPTPAPNVTSRLEGAASALRALLGQTGARPGSGGIFGAAPRREPDALFQTREALQRALDRIHRGDQIAGSAYTAQLERAVAALDALLGAGLED